MKIKKIILSTLAAGALFAIGSSVTTVNAATVNDNVSVSRVASATQTVQVTNPNGAIIYNVTDKGLMPESGSYHLAYGSKWAATYQLLEVGGIRYQTWHVGNNEYLLIGDAAVVA